MQLNLYNLALVLTWINFQPKMHPFFIACVSVKERAQNELQNVLSMERFILTNDRMNEL